MGSKFSSPSLSEKPRFNPKLFMHNIDTLLWWQDMTLEVFRDKHRQFGEARGSAINFNKNLNAGVDANASARSTVKPLQADLLRN